MKTLLLFLAISLCVAAQTTINVPGVTLSGPNADPVIENHSGKQIIAAMVILTYGDGRQEVHRRLFVHKSDEFSDKTSKELGAGNHKRAAASPVVSAKLLAVIFHDGELRGEDNYQFQRDAEQDFASIRQSFVMAKAGDWAGLRAKSESLAPQDSFGAAAAFYLLAVHNKGGDINSLGHYGLLPAATWRGSPLGKIPNAMGEILAALANWIQPTAYAQGAICCIASYDNSQYFCQTWPYGSNPDCPDPGGNTPWVGRTGSCPSSATVGIKVTLANNDPKFPQFGMGSSLYQNTLVTNGSCKDVIGAPPWGGFESYRYHIDCNNVTIMDYDFTRTICGVSHLQWPG
jgi:hypothetical protein